MPVLILIVLVVVTIIVIAILFWRQKAKLPQYVHQHLDMIRAHEVLLKPDRQAHTFSGRYAGRLMWFSFDKDLLIRAEAKMGREDSLWIYPANHRFNSDKFKAKLEQNRAWTGNSDFDKRFILAGRPRIFANAVIYPAINVQSTLLQFPHALIEVNQTGVELHPNLKDKSQITEEIWGTWMGLVADIAELVEAQYSPSMFSGIEVDETAYPDHSQGHLK